MMRCVPAFLNNIELTDTQLALDLYDNVLYLALISVDIPDDAPGPGPLDTRFAEINAIDLGSRTILEQKLFVLTRAFSTYVVAHEVGKSLPLLAAKSISDSKASVTRFSDASTYESVMSAILNSVKSYRDAIVGINDTTYEDERPWLSAINRDYDRVTDE